MTGIYYSLEFARYDKRLVMSFVTPSVPFCHCSIQMLRIGITLKNPQLITCDICYYVLLQVNVKGAVKVKVERKVVETWEL